VQLPTDPNANDLPVADLARMTNEMVDHIHNLIEGCTDADVTREAVDPEANDPEAVTPE
jgi:hypothetical protein